MSKNDSRTMSKHDSNTISKSISKNDSRTMNKHDSKTISKTMSKTMSKTISKNDSITEEKKKTPKYLFLAFFSHGIYNESSRPFKSQHSSVNIRTLRSVPKLMTYISCSPGCSLIGENDGEDNILLTNFFKRHSENNFMNLIESDTIEKNKGKKHKTTDTILSQKFLDYIHTALSELTEMPRHRTNRYKIKNPHDIDVCRNSFIGDNKIGNSYNFANKIFTTDNKPRLTNLGENWGVFIYNNNCGIESGTDINEIKEIKKNIIIGENGQQIGFSYELKNIISGLVELCKLTSDDYLFLYDYSCNNFSDKIMNQPNDSRTIRRLGRSITSDFGFGRKKRHKYTQKYNIFNKHNKKTMRKK
jgi:hypothetical protein